MNRWGPNSSVHYNEVLLYSDINQNTWNILCYTEKTLILVEILLNYIQYNEKNFFCLSEIMCIEYNNKSKWQKNVTKIYENGSL